MLSRKKLSFKRNLFTTNDEATNKNKNPTKGIHRNAKILGHWIRAVNTLKGQKELVSKQVRKMKPEQRIRECVPQDAMVEVGLKPYKMSAVLKKI
ncbi:hypothetical protein DPMN_007673 [Dreissena polymorpha]|uniref:Uncharacterized protein n=1 Tax=Dreissena polymorpha TaxID=45954 RepID=A0A9D4MYW6_DREPO|nr:hypothetical protein DPMN_007673 [Dreissena polymorpha]